MPLKFAQALADREIAAIDRLHQRTLKHFGYAAAGFGVELSFFAWVGYENLTKTAIPVATQEVQDEVCSASANSANHERSYRCCARGNGRICKKGTP